jgi:transcriptional adapter 2-alpha
LKDITRCTYIQCSECQNLFFCILCFAVGKLKSEHLLSHRYSVIDPIKFPVFVHEWSGKEEMLLLEGLLKFGYGNWGCISEHLGSKKNAWECEKHYKQIYLGKSPDHLNVLQVLSSRDEAGFVVTSELTNCELFMDIEEEPIPHPEKRPEIAKHPLSEFAGYMPLRKDFEIEYENDIEMYLADLEFYEDDKAEDVEIKLKQLEVYNKVLDEREERKNFVIERWPIELENEKKFKNNIIERTIYQALKPYARLLPPDKHLSLFEGLVKEYILKLKLEELKEAQSRGIKTEEEFKRFLNEKKNTYSAKSKEFETVIKEPFIVVNTKADEGMDELCKRIGISLDSFLEVRDEAEKWIEAGDGESPLVKYKFTDNQRNEIIEYLKKNKI